MHLAEVLTLSRPLLGLDLETTGVDSAARIVEIGLEIMIPGRPVKEYRTLVNPGCPIPPDATAVHGITDEMVADAPRFEALADNLLKGFTEADFAGYNVRFDLRTMAMEFRRVRRTWDYEGARVIDGLRLWQVVEGRSLEHAIKRWLQPHRDEPAVPSLPALQDRNEKAHNALYDVTHSTRVIAAQILAGDLSRDLDVLHELCSPGWFDAEGKFVWKGDRLHLSFGKHRGREASSEPGFLQWMLRNDFSPKVKDACRLILAGGYPTRTIRVEENTHGDDPTEVS
jgi:DNA polymerase-3 subunit epsilon